MDQFSSNVVIISAMQNGYGLSISIISSLGYSKKTIYLGLHFVFETTKKDINILTGQIAKRLEYIEQLKSPKDKLFYDKFSKTACTSRAAAK